MTTVSDDTMLVGSTCSVVTWSFQAHTQGRSMSIFSKLEPRGGIQWDSISVQETSAAADFLLTAPTVYRSTDILTTAP
jgi:hypothetical protein